MEQEKKVHEELFNDIFRRGVGEFIDPGDVFRNKLAAKARGEYPNDLVVKFGVDVTRPDIHLGHAAALRKLRALQDLGCKIVFLIGDFTTLIGDPTGKSRVRPEIDFATVAKHMATFLGQVDKILLVDRNERGEIVDSPRFSWMRNSEWYFGVTDISTEGASAQALIARLGDKEISIPLLPNSFVSKAVIYENTRMQKTLLGKTNTYTVSFVNLLSILRHIPFAQLIERDMFQERIARGEPLFMHEVLYPVIQGVDSSVLADIYGSCDLEVGGTDQTFNMLMGRRVMEMTGKVPQAVLALDLLVGLDGKEKMSKSLDNYIAVTDEPQKIFGKIMSLHDELIPHYYELCTFTPSKEIERITKGIRDKSIHPRDAKMDLAQQIVEIYHGREAGLNARKEFVRVFQEKEAPGELPVVRVTHGTLLGDALRTAGMVASKSEWRRLVDEGAIKKFGNKKITDPSTVVSEDVVLKIGKHRFVKIVVE